MRIVSLKEMNSIESKAAKDYGFNETLVVENVGIRGADKIHERLSKMDTFDEIVIIVGKGNNGADGLAIARYLSQFGHRLRAFLLFSKEECSHELKEQIKLAKAYGVRFAEVKSQEQLTSYFAEAGGKSFVIDAILGTGVRLPLSNFLLDIINVVNSFSDFTVSIDIPTGVMGDTGTYSGSAIKANITYAVALPKLGHYLSSGSQYIGELEVLRVGFPADLLKGGNKILLSPSNVSSVILNRDKFAHKNVFGHLLVIGGSAGKTGALILAAKGGQQVGAGLVSASTWEENYSELTSRVSEDIMTYQIPSDNDEAVNLVNKLDPFDSIVIGPGLGIGERARQAVRLILSAFNGPLVLDADAINVLDLKEDAELFQKRRWPTLLTPHFGEMSRLVGVPVEKLKERPLDYLKETIEKINCSILVKGPCSYLGFPNGDAFLSYYPNEGMATGGIGDVLTGMMGGLFAQRTALEDEYREFRNEIYYQASCLGLVAHSLAGKYAAEELGKRSMSARSLVNYIAPAFCEIEK